MSAIVPVTKADILAVATVRRHRALRRRIVITVLAVLVLAAFATTLMAGKSFVPPWEVIQVLLGADTGASFTVGTLRLPRAVLSVVAGLSFGLGGAAFQTLLRNPLASPDIIGISSSASAAAVFAIVVLSLDGPASPSLPSPPASWSPASSSCCHSAAAVLAPASFSPA